MNIRSDYIRVENSRAYQAAPSEPSGAGMLLLPMITGIGEQIREFAQVIASQTACTALVWDPFHGRSSDNSEVHELRELLVDLNAEAALAEQQQLLDHMRTTLKAERIGVIGWCMGGRFAFLLGARNAALVNIVAVHPTVTLQPAANQTIDPFEQIPNIAAPVLLAYPGRDSIVSQESFERMQRGLQARTAAPTIVHLYPEAKHGFSDARNHEDRANREAFQISWPQILEFIRNTTRKAPPVESIPSGQAFNGL